MADVSSVEEQVENALRRAVRVALNNATSTEVAKAFVQKRIDVIFEEI